jgi:hypothetical protein
MRRNHNFFFIVGMAAILFLSSGQARGFAGYFGTQDHIKCIQPIKEDQPAGEKPAVWIVRDLNSPKYSLCHKYSTVFFFAGVYLHDDGYVLAEGDDAYQYVPLDSAKITEFQEKGILPNPLPGYAIPLSQYLIGYSLWILLVVLITGSLGWYWFKRWRYRGIYCLNCELILTDRDISTGKCGDCGEPIPVQNN